VKCSVGVFTGLQVNKVTQVELPHSITQSCPKNDWIKVKINAAKLGTPKETFSKDTVSIKDGTAIGGGSQKIMNTLLLKHKEINPNC